MKGRLSWKRLIGWSVVFVLAMLAGALTFAYTYVTDSSTLVAIINAHVPRFLPGSRLRIDRVQLRPLLAEVDLRMVALLQPIDGVRHEAVRIPWLQIRCDPKKLWNGQVEPREIIVVQPTLRLKRRSNGRWNVQGLLADPWPSTAQLNPTVRIRKGMIELLDGHDPALVVHDVDLTIEPTDVSGRFSVAGSAQGGEFERLAIEGTLDANTGELTLTRGELNGLSLTENLARRLPREVRQTWDDIGLTGGELNVAVEHLRGRRDGTIDSALRLELRDATWASPRLPFPLSDVSAAARLADGQLVVTRAEGRYGKTLVRVASAQFDATDPEHGPMSLEASVEQLALDATLRNRLPAEFRKVWDDFAPPGRPDLGQVSLSLRARRTEHGRDPDFTMAARLIDAGFCFRLFPYEVQRVNGTLVWSGQTLTVQHLETVVGGQPMTAKGTILNPGPQGIVDLTFTAGALPIEEDGPFMKALPPDIRATVKQFHPTGSVRGSARMTRRPSADPKNEAGDVKVDAVVDLNDGCTIRWDGMPYPVLGLTGRLEVHPDHCVFTEMKGRNGQARIAASGRVDVLGPGRFAADVRLNADKLPFDQQLRQALPPEWQATWSLLNPLGSSQVESHVVAGYGDPNRPDSNWLRLTVRPEDEARVKLRITPAPGTPGLGPDAVIELPAMQDVRGEFVFDNGLVTMTDVSFNFREAQTHVRTGQVRLEQSGQFDLKAEQLDIRRLRFDPELRAIMPPLMADFAARLDDGKPFAARGDLSIRWSGQTGDPAVCAWENAAVFFDDNTIAAGIPLRHIHGQIDHIRGQSDGRTLEVAGAVDLDSFILAGQQVRDFTSPLTVGNSQAVLGDIAARLLDGDVRGQLQLGLSTTPEYTTRLTVTNADLARYTQTIPGPQQFRGKINGQLVLQGVGDDLRRLNGSGEAHLTQGDIGALPFVFRLMSVLNLNRSSKAAFDAADLKFNVRDGLVQLDPVKITGNTISLYGGGTIDPHGDIDLQFKPLYGRDERLHIPGVSDLTRELGGKLFIISAKGPIASPRLRPIPLPEPSRRAAEVVRRLGTRRDEPRPGR